METFLEPTDEGAFLDFPAELKEKPDHIEGAVICQKCKGHGGWNLKLNAYPLHDREDTAENRHRYVHFRAACSVCNGWGWREPADTCIHEWENDGSEAQFLHRLKCRLCGATELIDSSD